MSSRTERKPNANWHSCTTSTDFVLNILMKAVVTGCLRDIISEALYSTEGFKAVEKNMHTVLQWNDIRCAINSQDVFRPKRPYTALNER